MIYNIALTFDKETSDQIYNFYKNIKNNLNVDVGLEKNSIPHATIIKFESQSELDKNELNEILNDLECDITVDFSGITFLPSRSGEGCWVELPILKSKQLVEIQNKLLTKLTDFKIVSGTENRFRPHITFVKTKDCKTSFDDLDSSILRKAQVNAKIVIGKAGHVFEIYEL